MNNALDFSDLETLDDLAPSTKKVDDRQKYSCSACGGSGTWVSPMGRKRGKCHACNGRGFFLTSPEQRRKNRTNSVKRKTNKLEEAKKAFCDTHRSMVDALLGMMEWNDFARSLCQQIDKRGSLSDKQIASANKMIAKMEERKAEKAKVDADRPVIDLAKIHGLFLNAHASGVKKPILRIGELKISEAPATGKNGGHLYVKDDGEYAGKISPEGKFFPLRSARKEIEQELIDLAVDPMGIATQHGRETGKCSCCGRVLTNKDSIEAGIGPICASKWGM